jgi:hypothetical protein
MFAEGLNDYINGRRVKVEELRSEERGCSSSVKNLQEKNSTLVRVPIIWNY